MEQWIRDNFEIIADSWSSGKDSFRFYSNEDVVVESPIDWFISEFDVPTPPMEVSLKSKDPEDLKGWHIHFTAWKEQGLFPLSE